VIDPCSEQVANYPTEEDKSEARQNRRELMRFGVLLLILILALLATPAGIDSRPVSPDVPDINTSRGFLEFCALVDKDSTHFTSAETYMTGFCLGWMAGLTSGIHVAEGVHQVSEKNVIFCAPAGISILQTIHITKKFITDHPEKEQVSTAVTASVALAEAFPCKESK
jgi:hypothetical protein